MRSRRSAAGWLLVLSACAASVPETEHKAALSRAREACEKEVLRMDLQRRNAEDERAELARRLEAERHRGEERADRWAEALADKQRQLDSSGRRAPSARPKGIDVEKLRAQLETAWGGGAPPEMESVSGAVWVRLDADRLFGPGSVEIQSREAETMDRLAKVLAGLPGVAVEVRVHTDDVEPVGGLVKDAWSLGALQASALVSALAARGMDPTRLSATSLGRSRPVAKNTEGGGRAQNRRVELRLIPGGAGRAP